MTYVEKAEQISEEDRDYVRSELASLAEWLKNRYPSMTFRQLNRFLREMLGVSV